MAEDLRHRYAEALASTNTLDETDLAYTLDLVMAVRDEELERLRYERRLLGAARMVLDLVAAGDSSRWDQARRAAADVAQRIVDEIGHPVTDEPALGPGYRTQIHEWRERAEKAEVAIARVREVHARDVSNPHGPWCGTCLSAWPCPTIAALDDQEADRGTA